MESIEGGGRMKGLWLWIDSRAADLVGDRQAV